MIVEVRGEGLCRFREVLGPCLRIFMACKEHAVRPG